jgi:hypothetical protein
MIDPPEPAIWRIPIEARAGIIWGIPVKMEGYP